MTTHRRGGNEAAVSETFEFGLFLVSPNPSCCSGTMINAIDIDPHHVLIAVEITVDHISFGPWNSGIGNEDIKTVIELLDLRCDGIFNEFGVLNIDLVRLAYVV